ncbi:hypothetical protein JOC86_001866 [Bacillus pakistanensis]|uniref:DUF3953 domain-containing protein n=1 Tax=Rossellomorea pakistanensis TaxID=992288 RepID=A0ABS2NBY4_9BACI|nr:DUF3953 domain-containing protein [Bacillus pakistanensis]MBM7585324.1 hypothetical protein [Bacillus pakistanensis]
MLKKLKVLFGVISSILAIYSFITDRFSVMPYMLFFLAAMMLVMGMIELQENRKSSAIAFFLVFGFNLFVSVYVFIG